MALSDKYISATDHSLLSQEDVVKNAKIIVPDSHYMIAEFIEELAVEIRGLRNK